MKMNYKSLIAAASTGAAIGMILGVINNKRKTKKCLTFGDILPYINSSVEVRCVNKREQSFFIFLKNGNYIDFYVKNVDRIIEQDVTPADFFVLKGADYKGNFKSYLNKAVHQIKASKVNEEMLEIVLL